MKLLRVLTLACLLPIGGTFGGGCAKDNTGGVASGGAGVATGGRGTGSATGSSGGATGNSGGATGGGGTNGATGGRASGGVTASGGVNGSGGVTGSGGGGGGTGTIASGGNGAAGRGGSGTGGGPSGGTGGAVNTAFKCPAGPFAAPMLTGLTPTRIPNVPPSDAFNKNGTDFAVIEGPVWVGDGLYVSQIENVLNLPRSRILKVTIAGAVTIALDNAGINGLALDENGNLVGCNHKDGAITRFALPGLTPTNIVSMFGGQRFDSPNDLTFRADGNLYFSDPNYQAAVTRPQAKTRLYRVAPGATVATVIDETRNLPNGVTLSPDGNTLYVSAADGLYRYPVATDGSVGTATKIAQSIGNGDGMAIDCAGNLYVATNNTLAVVDAGGNPLGTITVAGVQNVTNAAFGGADHKTLYITGLGTGSQTGLFSVGLNVPGFPY
jgi:gluconolactonase